MDGHGGSRTDNKMSFNLGGPAVQLSGSDSGTQQIRALASCNQAEDLSFRESSVKDITDKGRTQAAAKLQEILEEVIGAASANSNSRTTAHISDGVLKRKAATAFAPPASSPAVSSSAPQEEHVMRQEVREDVAELQRIRLSGGAETSSALEILNRLELLPMTVSCLKCTKIALEINNGFWRNNQVAMIREVSSGLVHKWKAIYRVQSGVSTAVSSEPAKPISSQRLRTMSMICEESCYAHIQATQKYRRLMDAVGERLCEDPKKARQVAIGGLSPVEFVKSVVQDLKIRDIRRDKQGMETKNRSSW